MKLRLTKLNKISDKRGKIVKFLSKNSKNFKRFGEIYLSYVKYKSIKAWKMHSIASLNLMVIKGEVKFVFFDDKKKIFKKLSLKENSNKSIYIPKGLWFGFMGLKKSGSVIISLSTHIFHKKEINRKNLKEIKFNWNS